MTDSIDLNPDSDEPINIGFFAHRRAIHAAERGLGGSWGPSHDRFVVKRLFKAGEITEYQKQILFDNIAEKVKRTRRGNPAFGRYRVW